MWFYLDILSCLELKVVKIEQLVKLLLFLLDRNFDFFFFFWRRSYDKPVNMMDFEFSLYNCWKSTSIFVKINIDFCLEKDVYFFFNCYRLSCNDLEIWILFSVKLLSSHFFFILLNPVTPLSFFYH